MRTALLLAALGSALAGEASAWDKGPPLADLSLEQLRELRVITVSRIDEGLDRAAASAYVITAEHIQRSGAATLAEALRLAPTLDVARADANQYAISARGFANVLANKMLVMVDGRTVYTPLFSGVFWEAQDLVLGDIERIEVVSGPSTALWGSNAVNGLIHIITKSAATTQGAAGSVEVGNWQRSADLRHGMRVGEAALRLYGKATRRDETRRADGSGVQDAFEGVQAGLRADWGGADERMTLQGDAYEGHADSPAAPRRFAGASLRARWERADADGAGTTLQAYVDHTRRDHRSVFRQHLDTLDLVAQHGFAPAGAHRWLLGAGLRHARDRVGNSAALAFLPAERSLRWTRLFVQDQIAWRPGLDATLAASVEHNPYTGVEFLPSARLAWRIADGGLAWMAASRAVRAPSRIDRDYVQPAVPPRTVAGGPDFRSEVTNTLEFGLRAQHGPGLSSALTLFHHRHTRQRSLAPTPQGLELRNDIEGRTQGIEAWARWQPTASWRLHAGLVAQRQRLGVRSGGVDQGGLAALGNDPQHWASLRSLLELSDRLSWDLGLRHVGARAQPAVPAYTALDSRLAYRTDSGAELALVLRNALDPGHPEWGVAGPRAELQREVALRLAWRY